MASAWPKFLAQITVPQSGLDWDFVFSDGSPRSVTVSSGTYTTILHLAKELQDRLQALGGGHASDTVTVSSAGYITLSISGLVSVTWASTNDDLEALLGLAGTETPVAGVLTALNPHTHGWYPGVISLGTSMGIGISSDSEWTAGDDAIRTIAGNGVQSIIMPSRLKYDRMLVFSGVRREEVRDRKSGVAEISDHPTVPWAWYLDRTVGTTGSYGTQGDPGDGDVDGDIDWWSVTFNRLPRTAESPASPDYFDVSLMVNGEPD